MNNEYIIVNKTDILKRIEELEKANEYFKHAKTHNPTMAACEATLSTLKQVLSQSTPLIPEIEKDLFMDTNKKLEFSEEDMIEFYHFVNNYGESGDFEPSKKELLQLWKKTTT